VDARVQDLQGKAERVKPAEILRWLVEAYREKAALRCRHEADAGAVGEYDANNTYQYVIAREDQHLRWLADAIQTLGGAVPDLPAAGGPLARATGEAATRAVARADAEALDAFVGIWRPRVAEVSNARHRLMLDLMLGEMMEQARLFHQASEGRVDLLGRRTGGERLPGAVLPTRWVE
jgi:hypothetical protein